MATTQTAYRGRTDTVALNSQTFTYGPDTPWVQGTGTFRVRFAVDGTGTIPGQLEFSTSGTAGWTNVTDTSGTIQATRSLHYADGDATTYCLTTSENFVGGAADETDGIAGTVTLASQHTEFEYCLQTVPADVTAGGTIFLRVDGVDTYTRTAQVVIRLSDRERVRLKIGDSDSTAYKLTNAEVDACVADWPNNVDLAAANAAEAIAAKYADGYNFASDGQSFNRRERFMHYRQLAAALRNRGGTYSWPNAA